MFDSGDVLEFGLGIITAILGLKRFILSLLTLGLGGSWGFAARGGLGRRGGMGLGPFDWGRGLSPSLFCKWIPEDERVFDSGGTTGQTVPIAVLDTSSASKECTLRDFTGSFGRGFFPETPFKVVRPAVNGSGENPGLVLPARVDEGWLWRLFLGDEGEPSPGLEPASWEELFRC